MAPSPISQFETSFEIDVHSEMVLRAKWDGREIDPKVVGSHLPLSKRNSTPVSCGLNAPIHNELKNILSQQQLQSIKNATLISHVTDPLQNVHRKLDRSYSEPVRPQIQPNQVTTGASRYKTELCRPFAETGKCKYSDKCQFAHGLEELRSMTRHPKYKTELCRTFHSTGLCGYGTRCHFIHNEDERRPASSPTGVSPPPPSVGSPMGISCRTIGPLSMAYVTPEEYAVGNNPTYVGQSSFSNDSLGFGPNNYCEQSPKHYTSGLTSPSFSVSRSSSDSYGQTPPQVSPTCSESSFFNPLFSQRESFGPITHSPPLVAANELIVNELSCSALFNDNLNTLDESALDHMKLSLVCNLPDSPEPPIIPFGIRDPSNNSGLRLPIFKNLTKV